MKYIPVFHPSGVAMRSKSVPEGFVTKDFTIMYVEGWALPTVIAMVGNAHPTCFVDLTWVPQLNTDQVRARPSGETGGLHPAPAPVILVRNAG